MAGGNDFLVHVAVGDSQRLRDFALDAFTTRKEVAHIETNLIFSFQRNPDAADLQREQHRRSMSPHATGAISPFLAYPRSLSDMTATGVRASHSD